MIIRRKIQRQDYPELWNFKYPPRTIYAEGLEKSFQLLEGLPFDGLAIVGTRSPSKRVCEFLRQQIPRLRNSHLVILSGLAKGIDSLAHELALESNLPTIAVLGCGLNFTYPPENQDLRNRIIENGGLIMTELQEDLPPVKTQFISRNRLIAGWSKAVLVAEAPRRSGALNTAKWAREFYRETYSIPCFPGDPQLAGNQKLMEDENARVFWSVSDLGSSWMSLSTQGLLRLQANAAGIARDVAELRAQIQALTTQSGGASVPALLQWATELGWTPQRFFDGIKAVVSLPEIEDRQGILMG